MKIEKQRKYLPSAVNVRLKLSNITSSFSITSHSLFLNHTKIKKVSLTIHCKYKYSDSTVQRAEDRRQKFYFCRLSFSVNVKLNLSNAEKPRS